MRTRLESINLKGFKTIRELKSFRPGPLTVLIGPNGAGKSNFISFFRLLQSIAIGTDSFQRHVGQQGGASKLLLDGPTVTPEIDVELCFDSDKGRIDYHFRLAYAANDTFIFAEERYRVAQGDQAGTTSWQEVGAGHRGSQLSEIESNDDAAYTLNRASLRMFAYQFHDTSMTSHLRRQANVTDNVLFWHYGSNISPFLYRLKRNEGRCYQRIVDTLRLILPFFSDFFLEPDNDQMLLAWRERDSDQVFYASQAADGMLRAIALVTLLLQPDETLPDVLIIDEPELGLHPTAINIIGGLIRAASQKVQVIVATQSTTFVDCFDLGDVVVVEREGRESLFRRQENSDTLKAWLKEYSPSELWLKNVIGGRP